MTARNISGRIRQLPELVIDKIAAGEVIDGPYSIVKELMENAVDAGARSLTIETESGGAELIRVQDDGAGIAFEDLPVSVRRHATSKIQDVHDIESILSYGFRGEALASIASVSYLEIKSRNRSEDVGGILRTRGGETDSCEPAALNPGTAITVQDLFYTTPARKKFLKSERFENQRVFQEVIKVALANPEITLRYVRDGKEHLHLPAGELKERIAGIYRKGIGEHLLPVEAGAEGLRLHGYITDGFFYRSNRDAQYQFVNGRAVDLKYFSTLVKKSYGELLPHGSFPYFFLFLELDPARVDVNVHPAKREVRLNNMSLINSLLIHGVTEALRTGAPLEWERAMGDRFKSHLPGKGDAAATGTGAPASTPEVRELLFRRPEAMSGPIDAARGFDVAQQDFDSSQNDTRLRSAADDLLEDAERRASCAEGESVTPNQSAGQGASAESAPNVNAAFLPRKHFGVLFGTYILAEAEDGLYIIDQHTAHERINYEKQRARFEALRKSRQPLLHPMTVECLPDELALVMEKGDLLEDNGFVVEEFGRDGYIVRETPAYIEPGTEQDAVEHVIQRVLDGETDIRLYDELAAMKACKASIKRNDYVDGEVISGILRELATCEDPSRCPHGRPTMVRISPADLDKLFLR